MNLKKVFVLGTAGFAVVCLGLFYILNASLSLRSNDKHPDYNKVKSKLEVLENAVLNHRKTMKELESLVHDQDMDNEIYSRLSQGKLDANRDNFAEAGFKDENNMVVKPPPGVGKGQVKTCSAAYRIGTEATSDIKMLGVYDEIPFDDVDGGAWKQGWEIQINQSRFSASDKLKVIVIPHSHNDPGWIKTFEAYYETQTKHILNSMLEKLSIDSSLKFVWAEISYFSMWWDEISEQDKVKVKELLANKQLEFVTGGWVMPDEAGADYYGMLVQMIEGHQWLLHHLDYIPRNGWAIDPFGMSPTNAYLLRRTGLTNMLIQRTHYEVKKYLASKQELEFHWRQNWDPKGTADMLCHMMPFYSYDVPHTCGPDPSVCCQFDFKRMRSVSHLNCPWNKQPQPIRPQNVKERATLLLDQYRKKAMLYKTNVLLIPLGDDFRWEDNKEWEAQASNYEKIFAYINANPELLAECKFGTLEDYFSELNKEITSGKFSPKALTGDFFTYADRSDHYWSGYFTSRPFHKSMDRQLGSLLKGAQMAYMFMTAEVSKRLGHPENFAFVRELLGKIIKSRRSFSLFQHHDGVAGTAKDHVVTDYAKKMFTALNDCNHVMQQSIHVLTHLDNPSVDLKEISETSEFYKPVIAKDTHTDIPHYNLVVLDRDIGRKIIKVFNPSGRRRSQLVRLYVSTYRVEVVDLLGNLIPHEVIPVFESDTEISSRNFEINFVADVPALSIKNYFIAYKHSDEVIPKPEILVFNLPASSIEHNLFGVNKMPEAEPIQISNGYITVNFDNNGFTKSISINGKEHTTGINFISYGAKMKSETSGLYLFFPDGDAVPLPVTKPFIKVVKGKFQSYVEVSLTQVKHRITVHNHPGFERYAVEIKNLVDIRKERNFELAMKIKTDISSKNVFYTDLNGFQMIRRMWRSKLPTQANYYPIPSAAFIESKATRMTLLSAQPLGGASLKSGEIEIMMDRRLMQDDNRGAGQGCTDNLETMHTFRLLFEAPVCEDPLADDSPPMLSLPANLQLQDIQLPFQLFVTPQQEDHGDSATGVSDYNPLSFSQNPIPCDVEILSAIPLPEYANPMDDRSYVVTPKSAILLHRVGFDGRFLGNVPLPQCSYDDSNLGRFSMKQIFGELIRSKVQQTTLSFLVEGKELTYNETILMKPMEVYGFLTSYNLKR